MTRPPSPPSRGVRACSLRSLIRGVYVASVQRFAPPARAAFAWGGPAQTLRS